MGKFVVIEKRIYDSMRNMLKNDNIEISMPFTELSTDESIIDRAERYGHSIDKNDDMREFFAYKVGATEQSIIEQMKEKEFAEWCSINGWYFYKKDSLWRKHGNGGFEYKTTEELFNQFTNQK